MTGTFLFLGTGASTGIPVVGCHCAVCSSSFPHNRRLRSSGLLQVAGKKFLMDAGPDFRQQALLHRIEEIDGLLLTHTHFDHIAGIDDLRISSFRMKRSLPCLLSKESLRELERRYFYLLKQFQFQLIEEDRCRFQGIEIDTCHYAQQGMCVTGYRIGSFAYISDIRDYTSSLYDRLQGVQTLVVSATGKELSHAHFSVEEAISFARTIGAERTWLTHLSHHLDHEETESKLPPDIRMGYDGLSISFS